LRTEEDFVAELGTLNNYIQLFDDKSAPDDVFDARPKLALNEKELFNFHANILLKGLQYVFDWGKVMGIVFV
jgi:hypothetical protein